MTKHILPEDLDAPTPPVRQPFGTGTNPKPKPLTEAERAAIAASNAEYRARRTTLKAQAAIALDPNSSPEAQTQAAQVLKFYQDAVEAYVEQNPTCHPDSAEADLSARFDVWFELDVVLEPPA
jgi:hypothetical protein